MRFRRCSTTIVKVFLLAAVLFCGVVQSCSKEGPEKKGSTWEQVKPGGDGGDENLSDPEYAAAYKAAGATGQMCSRALAFRQAGAAAKYRNGAYVYSSMLTKYASNPSKLASRLYVLGYRDVYLSPGKSKIQSADSWLKSFNEACHSYGMRVLAIRISDNSLLVKASDVDSEVSLIKDYNAKVSAAQRFDGISADLEPHTVHGSNIPSGMTLSWDSSNNYGIGKDNDQLLKLTLDVLSRASSKLSGTGLSLCEAVNYSFQSNFDSGKLSWGSTPQFLEACDYIIVMAYLNTMESVWSKSEGCLKAADKKESVSIAVKTAVNSSDSSTLQPKGWNYLLETMSYLVKKASSYASFRGIDMFTFEGLETMWEWENDKN